MVFTRTLKLYDSFKWIKLARRTIEARRGFSNFRGTYKVVNKSATDRSDDISGAKEVESNWELLNPEGFRFFLPGSIGPAWHDDISLSFMSSSVSYYDVSDLQFETIECPSLLREGLQDLFREPEVMGSFPMTVIKISSNNQVHYITEQQVERISKQFVCVAERMCGRLKLAGFWADFINPFSGSARFSVSHHVRGDDGISCLDSTLEDLGLCKVISLNGNQSSSKYIGCLYTNASNGSPILQDIIKGIGNL